jgi:signal transduction histidine kinase
MASVRENPLHAPILAPVIEALAVAELAMIEQDPNLPFRRGRGPRGAPPPPESAKVIERIAALEHAVRVREEHLAIIAHDLRGPLSPVLLLVRRLRDDLTAAGRQAVAAFPLLMRVEAVSHRLDQFVDKLHRLLDSTRLQTSDLVLEPEPVDLPALVHEVVDEVTAGLPPAQTIAVTGAETLVGTWDRLRIEQIVGNLLSNALRFGAGNPIEIAIRPGGDPGLVVLAVEDHGIGIASADHQRIFDKHTRVSRAAGGFGLGLWIVRQLCVAMGGMVEVRSSPGAGATFTVTLPREPKRMP